MITEAKARLNIKNMVYKSPDTRSYSPIDWEKEIGVEDKEEMKFMLNKHFERYRNRPFKNEINGFMEAAYYMKIVDPNLLDNITLTNNDYENFLGSAVSGELAESVLELGRLRFLFPKKKTSLVFDQLDMNLERYKTRGNSPEFMESSIPFYYALFPEEIKNLSSDAGYRKRFSERIQNLSRNGDYPALINAEIARNIICGNEPTQLSRVDLVNYDYSTREAKELGAWVVFAQRVAQMKLHSASEIKMTENGLELTMPKRSIDFTEKTMLPVNRKF